jgi:hypothetical protein
MPARALSEDEYRLAGDRKTAVACLGGYGYINRERAVDIVACVHRLPREVVERLPAGRPATRPQGAS